MPRRATHARYTAGRMGRNVANTGPLTLCLSDVTRSWGHTAAPNRLSLTVVGPGITGLWGENGSGKTTLLRMLAQTVRPTEGTIEVDGCAIDQLGTSFRSVTAYAPHEPPAYAHRSVRQNLEFFARLSGVDDSRVGWALDAWELDHDRASRSVHELSRGWRQRYGLARADLAASARLVLLDEPTTGLDANGRRLLDLALDRWASSALVLVATHERDWIVAKSDSVVDLDECSTGHDRCMVSATSTTQSGGAKWA